MTLERDIQDKQWNRGIYSVKYWPSKRSLRKGVNSFRETNTIIVGMKQSVVSRAVGLPVVYRPLKRTRMYDLLLADDGRIIDSKYSHYALIVSLNFIRPSHPFTVSLPPPWLFSTSLAAFIASFLVSWTVKTPSSPLLLLIHLPSFLRKTVQSRPLSKSEPPLIPGFRRAAVQMRMKSAPVMAIPNGHTCMSIPVASCFLNCLITNAAVIEIKK